MNQTPSSTSGVLATMRDQLVLKRYSTATIRVYQSMLQGFLSYLDPLSINQATADHIRQYHVDLISKRNVSRSYQNQSINAIKFYFEKVLGRDRGVYQLERPKKIQKLPVVLHVDEVSKLLSVTDNLKHRAILTTLYSGGLRVGELINLKLSDIDSKSMRIWIREGKGVKDRAVMLSPHLLKLLRQYYIKYKPKTFLFEGGAGNRYSASSVRKILNRSTKKAGIQQRVVPHTLRHSFATHLLESGTNLRYIQSLLGHTNIRTTEIYTHVNSKQIAEVRSPLDLMYEKE